MDFQHVFNVYLKFYTYDKALVVCNLSNSCALRKCFTNKVCKKDYNNIVI